MSPKYSSLACQCEELFLKLLEKAVNTLSKSFCSLTGNWSFKAVHISDASLPPKNRICVTLSFLGSVDNHKILLEPPLVEGPSSELVLSITVHVGKHIWWYSSCSSIFLSDEREYFTLGGCVGPKKKFSLWIDVVILKSECLPRAA